jgi:hypothetical protein
MPEPGRLRPRPPALIILIAVAGVLPAAAGPGATVGVFSNEGDVGAVSRGVAASYDAATGTYAVGASGADIWGGADAFGFVWNRAEGDTSIAADISFAAPGGNAHRKGCLMFRRSLDAGSPYADVAVHGDGHIALQFRSDPDGPTRTIQCPAGAPCRVRLERRGPYVTVSLARGGGAYAYSGCAVRMPLDGPFLAGLAVSAHDNAAFETARFSGVELGIPKAATAEPGSALEVLAIPSLDRRVVWRSAGRMEAPHFSPDGASLYFDRGGRIYRLGLPATREPEAVDTGPATHCNDDHGISPDRLQLVISDYTNGGPSLMYLLPVGGGTPRRIDVPGPAYWHSWSPDGRTLAYCAARGGNYDVYTIPVAGGPETRLTTAPGNDNGPDYTPDGRWIYFHSDRTGRMQVWRMRADGSGQEPVTGDECHNWFPHPSPDGKWVAYLSSRTVPKTGHPPDGDYFLRLIPAAGGAPREISRFYGGNGCFNVPCWSRDSTRLAYATFEPVP